jgi:tricorn protease
MNKKMLFGLALACQTNLWAAGEQPGWLRWCSISPDGKQIAFTYCGDIYTVPAAGGEARQLTANTAYDYAPVWSPDSKHIAFASAREGSMDVYVSSLEGGAPKRITTNSGNEIPVAFLDNEQVLFSAWGMPSVDNTQYPSGIYTHIYKVSVQGGRPQLYSEWTMRNPDVGRQGVLFEDVKGYEDYWRKHQTSSIASDVWLYDGKNYRQLTSFKGENRNPLWAADGSQFYYLSEEGGSFNIFKKGLSVQDNPVQLTHYKDCPVRFLSASDNDLLCYSYDGEIYTLQPGGEPKKVTVRITRDDMQRDVIRQLRSSGASEISVSPKGNEIAFVMSGDVYVTSIDYKTTKQITDTPQKERTVDFAPDGRSLVYASERNGLWQVFQASLVKKDEKNFTYATEIKEEQLTDGKYTAFQPVYNPKGGEVAFLKNRTEICVLDVKSRKVRTVMDGKYQYSYTDGDQDFTWSPDGKWLLTEYIGVGGWNNKDIALVRADGSGVIHNLTNSGYSEGSPKWVLDGKAMIFQSDRSGYRSHGSWGSQRDEFIMFFDADAYDRFMMNKEELALLAEREKEEKEAEEKKVKEMSDKERKKYEANKEKEKNKDLVFDLEHLEERTLRLTPYSTNLGDAVLSKDGSKLYYVAPYEGGAGLWVQHIKEYRNELKMRGMDWANLDADPEVKNAYMASGGMIKKLDIENGRISNVPFEAFYTSRPDEERAYQFEHIWKQTKDKLYDPNMNGADWDAIYKTYSKYLPHINNNYDFAEMASEMLGELNVSHTGCRFGGYGGALPTASLGVFYDETYQGDGLKVKEVLEGSPVELAAHPIKAGAVILAIDGVKIKAGMDYYPLLEGKVGRYTRLTVKDGGKEFNVTVKPISSGRESDLLYDRWVKRNQRMVAQLSDNRVAYVHIKEMNAACFQKLYKELMSDENRNKDAVVVDTRHNGGGWLHDDICILLSGKRTLQYKPRGQFIGNDPFDRWFKPSCMLVCEDNYSNAHGTPWYYKEQGIGKLVGAPVPGTMTAVWWEYLDGGLVFGIPQVTAVDMRGGVLENQQLDPDIEVYNKPEDVLAGKDAQLEAAVQEMLKEIKQNK